MQSTSLPNPDLGVLKLQASARLPQYLRWLMAAIAVAALLGAAVAHFSVQRLEERHYSTAEAVNLAGRQRMLSQRLTQLTARQALGSQHDDPAALAALLRDSTAQLQADRQRLLQLPEFMARSDQAPAIDALVAAAQRALAAAKQPLAEGAVAPGPADTTESTDTAAAMVRAADAFLPAMDRFVGLLQADAEATSQAHSAARARIFMALALLVLMVTGLAGEYLAKRMTRQHRLLRRQAAELERLALVAERTDNAVIITDAQGLVTWVNPGFTRISGYTLQDMLGHTPGAKLQFEGTDPAVVQQMRQAVAAHQPIQTQVLNRAKNGTLYWLQLDIQPLRDEAGQCNGFIAVQIDITPQVMERQRQATLLRALPAGVVMHDTSGRVVEANDEACRILALSREQLLGRDSVDPRWQTVHEDESVFPGHDHPAIRALHTGQPVHGVAMGLALPDGQRRWLRVNAEPVLDPAGAVESVVASFIDVTRYLPQRQLLALTMDAAGLGTWDWQVASGDVSFNERWWQMLGYAEGSIGSQVDAWVALVHEQDQAGARQAMERHFADPAQPYRCEFRIRCANGSWAWVLAAGSAIERNSRRTPLRVVGVHLDITRRKELEQRLADAALTDALTGLPNRLALQGRLAQCAARALRDKAYRYALLYLDFDRFKQVNDKLGHEAGDELLRQIGKRLRNTLRPGDDLARLHDPQHSAARLGGDEFVALLEPLQRPEDVTTVAQRLLDALALPYFVAGQEVTSSVSIGIVTSDRADCEPEALLRDADIAMYEAKRHGRGRYVVFSHDMQARLRHTLDLEADLRRALRDGGEVFAVYQPIVDLATGRLRGVEALARWNHHTRGAVPPMEFIPLAEENGLIDDLGAHILHQACRDAVAWHQALGTAAPAMVSVNLSRAQIRQGSLATTVADALARSGLPPSALRLEVTESLAMQDPQMVAALHDVRALGISLALDDFGTGYSSLSSLDQLPLDAVKIDSSFVQKLGSNRYQLAVIEATLKVAAALQLDVVAEGVETEEQARILRDAGCAMAQGWLYGKPVAAEALQAQVQAAAFKA